MLLPTLVLLAAPGFPGPGPVHLQDDDEIEALVAAERTEADLLRRRGKLRAARSLLRDLLEEEPEDAHTRALLARVRFEQGRHAEALELGSRAAVDSRAAGDPVVTALCARILADMQLELGRYPEALGTLEPGAGDGRAIDPGSDARDAWLLGRALQDNGDREAAKRVYELALVTRRDAGWRSLLAKGHCEWALGRLTDASRSFVLADRAAKAGKGSEPEVLTALANLYFESEREVAAKGQRSAGNLYRDALELNPSSEGALLGLFELHRYNRRRVSRSPESILGELLSVRPNSIGGLLAKASADLSDGQLPHVREGLARLKELAPGRRERATLEAALAWVEHRRDDCQRILEDLTRNARFDSRPEREVGQHLVELYRFSEALEFLERAVQRDPTDFEAWTWLGRALANVGREDDARGALAKAKAAAGGRQDAWRNNMDLVLRRMSEEQVRESFGALTFSWNPAAAEVLRAYLVPFYQEAREELAQRYGYTPEPTTIEVFPRHQDFSVRSVGFEGFPALGVCFGPVVTAISPLSEMRGQFSWARTGFHEFSHVVHLGLSHNRCPRWITEGLATWEEVNRNSSWTRNMRRELIDARAQDGLIPVRELNRAFRGPRILFGYYQGGLLCQMLIEQHGFPPMIALLRAFDRGLDLDQAMQEVFDSTPEQLDESFGAWVDRHVAGLQVEPRWGGRRIARLRITLPKTPPGNEVERGAWADQWITVAWGSWQRGKRLDAEEALRLAELARPGGKILARAEFLRGEMALNARRTAKAKAAWLRAVELGGRDFRGLLGLGSIFELEADLERAEQMYLLAEQSFPGYNHPEFSAELKLHQLYSDLGREEEAMGAWERWLAWNPGVYDQRLQVGKWHAEAGRLKRASELFSEALQVDPFRRDLHMVWAPVLEELERWEEAEREYAVALAVPPQFDLDHLRYVGPLEQLPPGADPENLPIGLLRSLPGELVEPLPLTQAERVGLLNGRARCLRALGREQEADGVEEQAGALQRER
jgi:tetratricopeptide (TPR) repeat protein